MDELNNNNKPLMCNDNSSLNFLHLSINVSWQQQNNNKDVYHRFGVRE